MQNSNNRLYIRKSRKNDSYTDRKDLLTIEDK